MNWKDIKGYEGLYQVSDTGEVKSLSRYVVLFHGGGYLTEEKILEKRFYKGNGYYMVALFNNGERCDKKIHRLVASAFIDNPEMKAEVNHKDGNKLNNCDLNLEWTTHAENVSHAWETGLSNRKSNDVQCLCTGRKMKVIEAAKEIGLHKSSLWAMLRGEKFNWTNFIWY